MDLAELPNGGFSSALIEKEIPIAGPGRIRLKNTENAVRTRQAYYTDLDINGPVNSIRYIDDLLQFYQEPSAKGDATLVEIRKEEGRIPVVKAAVTF